MAYLLIDEAFANTARLSPDRSRVAYAVKDMSLDAGDGHDDARLAIVAGGTALAIPLPQRTIDAGDGGFREEYPAVAVVSASGGDLRPLAISDMTQGRIVGTLGGCSVAHGGGATSVALASVSLFTRLACRPAPRTVTILGMLTDGALRADYLFSAPRS